MSDALAALAASVQVLASDDVSKAQDFAAAQVRITELKQQVKTTCLQAAGSALMSASALDRSAVYSTPSGNRAIFIYRNEMTGAYPSDVFDVDLQTGQVIHCTGLLGRPSTSVALYRDGKLYLASADQGWLGVLENGQVRVIGKCADRDFGAMYFANGDLYLGTYPNSHLMRYRSSDDTLTDLGILDLHPPQFTYTLGVDTHYAYAGMGENPWYLVIRNLVTGSNQVLFKDAGDTGAGVVREKNGSRLYYWRTQPGAIFFYELTNGQAVQVSVPPPLEQWYEHQGAIVDLRYSPDWVFDLADADAYSGHDPCIRWQPKQGGAWQAITANSIVLTPSFLKRILPMDDDFLFVGEFYGPLFRWNPLSREVQVIGVVPFSVYDLLWNGGDLVYISAYPGATFEWNMTLPWTINRATSDFSASNPRQILSVGKYHYYQALCQNILCVAVHNERSSEGGAIGFYNTETGEKNSLRVGLELFDPRGLCTVGNRVLYSGLSLGAQSAVLIRVNPVSQQIEATYTPFPGSNDAAYLVSVSDTDVVGVSPNRAYRFNVFTRALIWQIALPSIFNGLKPADRRVWNDGRFLWFMASVAVIRLDPNDGSIKPFYGTNGPYNVFPQDGLAYLYGSQQIEIVDAGERQVTMFPTIQPGYAPMQYLDALDHPFGCAPCIDPGSNSDTAGAWPASNKIIYVPFRVPYTIRATSLWILRQSNSGNAELGIYNADGVRLATTGVISIAGTAGTLLRGSITPILLAPGLYYLAAQVDNTSATFRRHVAAQNALAAVYGLMVENAGALGLPATATFAAMDTTTMPHVGLITGA